MAKYNGSNGFSSRNPRLAKGPQVDARTYTRLYGGGGGSSNKFQPAPEQNVVIRGNEVFIDGQGFSVAPEKQEAFIQQQTGGRGGSAQQAIQQARQNAIAFQNQQAQQQAQQKAQQLQTQRQQALSFQRKAQQNQFFQETPQQRLQRGLQATTQPSPESRSFVEAPQKRTRFQRGGDFVDRYLTQAETSIGGFINPPTQTDIQISQQKERLKSDIEQYQMDVESFNILYGGRELTPEEFAQAQREGQALQNRQSNLQTREASLGSYEKGYTSYKEKGGGATTSFTKSFLTGVVTAPITLGKFGVGLVTSPKETISETITSFKQLPTQLKETPSTTGGYLAGQTLGTYAIGEVFRPVTAKATNVYREAQAGKVARATFDEKYGFLGKDYEVAIKKTPLSKTFQAEYSVGLSDKKIQSFVETGLKKRGMDFSQLSETDKSFVLGQTKAKIRTQPEKFVSELQRQALSRVKREPKMIEPLKVSLDKGFFAEKLRREMNLVKSGYQDVKVNLDTGKVVGFEKRVTPKAKPELTFDFDIKQTNLYRNLRNEMNLMRSGARAFDIEKGKFVGTTKAPKKPLEPLKISLDKGFFDYKTSQQLARFKSGADVVQVTKKGALQILEKPTEKVVKTEPKVYSLKNILKDEPVSDIQKLALRKAGFNYKQKLLQKMKEVPVQKQFQSYKFAYQPEGQLSITQQLQIQKSEGASVYSLTKSKQRQQQQQLQLQPQSFASFTRQAFAPRFASGSRSRVAQQFGQPTLELPAFKQPSLQLPKVATAQRQPLRQPKPLRSILQQTSVRGGLGRKVPPRARQSSRGTFSVEVRRRGKFRSIGSGLGLKQAFKLGRYKTAYGLGASFRVKGGNLSGVGTPQGYYKSKKEGGVYIERKEFRLSKALERAEISSFRRKKKKGKRIYDLF